MNIRKLQNRQECSHAYLDKDRTKKRNEGFDKRTKDMQAMTTYCLDIFQ